MDRWANWIPVKLLEVAKRKPESLGHLVSYMGIDLSLSWLTSIFLISPPLSFPLSFCSLSSSETLSWQFYPWAYYRSCNITSSFENRKHTSQSVVVTVLQSVDALTLIILLKESCLTFVTTSRWNCGTFMYSTVCAFLCQHLKFVLGHPHVVFTCAYSILFLLPHLPTSHWLQSTGFRLW